MERSPVGNPTIVDPTESGPSPSSNHLELGGEPFMEPRGKIVKTVGQARLGGQLVDRFMGQNAEVGLAPVEVKEQ